jgi:hypothetical protein
MASWLARPARADISIDAPRASAASPCARRRLHADGVTFAVRACPVALRGQQLVAVTVVARSADNAEHFAAADPLKLGGMMTCSGGGSGFGEASGGSDGWSTATRIAPRHPARWRRLLARSQAVGRGCTLELDLSLASFTRTSGADGPLDFARVTLAVSRRGATTIIVGAPKAR